MLILAGVMTLFIAIGNGWVLDAPGKWRLWRGLLMVCVVGLTYSGLAIWIAPSNEAKESTVSTAPNVKLETKPKVRITRFVPEVILDKPITLAVRYIVDAEANTKLYSKYGFVWIENPPSESDLKAVDGLEKSIWASIINAKPIGIPGTSNVGEKTFLTAPPKIELQVVAATNITATSEIIRKLDANSVLYFTGTMEDVDGNTLVEFCGRIDRFRHQMFTLCREHN